MTQTLGQKIIAFNSKVSYDKDLPEGFKVINPFVENPETLQIMHQFYDRYYNDCRERKIMLGINPGRLGAGTTGIPFTDTKHLEQYCHIKMKSAKTHEVSAMFIYQLIMAYGGLDKFYGDLFITSPFPLAIVRETKKGVWLNANYYDDKILFESVKDFMMQTLEEQLTWGINTNEAIILGKKNYDFIKKINEKGKFFKKLTPVEHPRYIQQYKTRDVPLYIDKYIQAINQIK